MTLPKVFLIGATGYLGSSLLPTLEAYANRRGISLKIGIRSTSAKPINTQAEIVALDYDRVEQLASQFTGTDVIISALKVTPDNIQIHNNVALAASKANVKSYIPSEFGTDPRATKYHHTVFDLKFNHKQYAQSLGLKTVSVYTSLFLELALNTLLDIKGGNSNWNIVGKSSDLLSLTSLVDLGHILARIAIIINENPNDIPSDIRVYSDTRSYDEYASIVKSTLGREINIKTENIQEVEKRYNDGISNSIESFFTVLKLISSEHAFDFSEDNVRDFINPNEKYFRWTKFKVNYS